MHENSNEDIEAVEASSSSLQRNNVNDSLGMYGISPIRTHGMRGSAKKKAAKKQIGSHVTKAKRSHKNSIQH